MYGIKTNEVTENNKSRVTAELPILPDEIWHKIFSYLTHKELKSATLVSKTWNGLISNSPRFILRTKLNINARTKNSLQILKISQRAYRRVEINFAETEYLSAAVTMWTEYLGQLELHKCTVVGSEFLELLRQSSSITALILHNVKIEQRDEFCDPVNLKVTDLSMQHKNDSSDWIFDHLRCAGISNYLKIYEFQVPSWKTDSVVKFLDRIEGHIKVLHLFDINLDNTSQPLKPTFTFKWDVLVIEPFGSEEMIISEKSFNMKQICEASTDNSTLRISLCIKNIYRARNALKILKFCKNIVACDFSGDLREFQRSDLNGVGTLPSIKNLKLKNHECSADPAICAAFFTMFPNVRNLTIEFFHFSSFNLIDMAMISSKLRSVEHLVIESNFFYNSDLSSSVFRTIRFPELTSITIGPIGNMVKHPKTTAELLEKILENNRKLKMTIFVDNTGQMDQRKCGEFLRNFIGKIDDGSSNNFIVARAQYINFSQLTSRLTFGDEDLYHKKFKTFASIGKK